MSSGLVLTPDYKINSTHIGFCLSIRNGIRDLNKAIPLSMTFLSVSRFPTINRLWTLQGTSPSQPSSSCLRNLTELIPLCNPLSTQLKMQFTLITSVLLACMTAFVSASPVPAPRQAEVPALMAREVEVEVARAPEANPEPGCSRYTCI